MAEPNYAIDYEDERFKQVEQEKQQAIGELDQKYNDMIGESDKYYQEQIEASKQWAEQQKQAQQAQTDLLIEQQNQQKQQAEKSYKREQTGAYVDWQKQSNAYGANAEQMAANGLTNSGYSESSQVAMYTTYQNRVATARESFNLAVLNYDNNIKEATLQNNSKMAEIAYQQFQAQLELSLQGFQYKNQLILEQTNKKQELDNIYNARWQNVLQQMNTENSMAEQVRQYNEKMAFEQQQAQQAQKNWEKEYALAKKSASKSSSGGSGGNNKNIQKDPETSYNAKNIDSKKMGQLDTALKNQYKMIMHNTKNENTAKTGLRNSLAFALSNGSINKDEFVYMAEKYGL